MKQRLPVLCTVRRKDTPFSSTFTWKKNVKNDGKKFGLFDTSRNWSQEGSTWKWSNLMWAGEVGAHRHVQLCNLGGGDGTFIRLLLRVEPRWQGWHDAYYLLPSLHYCSPGPAGAAQHVTASHQPRFWGKIWLSCGWLCGPVTKTTWKKVRLKGMQEVWEVGY